MRRLLALTLTSLALGTSQAAGPLTVYRADAAADAPTAPVFAVVATSPVADPTLTDGVNRFYMVRNAAGASISLHADADRVAGTVVLSFDPDGGGTLRDLSIARLEALVMPGGTIDQLLAGTSPDEPAVDDILFARECLQRALDDFLSGSARDDNAMKIWFDAALAALQDARLYLGSLSPYQIAQLEKEIVDIARLIASYHLELAVAACGACDDATGQPAKVCGARDALADGDVVRNTYGSRPHEAVDLYAFSASWSLQAQDQCN